MEYTVSLRNVEYENPSTIPITNGITIVLMISIVETTALNAGKL